MDYDQCVTLGELIARTTVQALPKICTIERVVKKRAGKVYLDYLQNGHGKLLVAPFSVRSIPGAPVSMPLLWSEVNGKLEIRAFTIKNAVARMEKLKKDPLIGILSTKPDLSAVLSELQGEL